MGDEMKVFICVPGGHGEEWSACCWAAVVKLNV